MTKMFGYSKLDENGRETEYWTKVASVEGNNVIYNSLNKNIRNLYSGPTRVNDRISLIFSDGVFGDLPKGRFKVVYLQVPTNAIQSSLSKCQTYKFPFLI